MSAALCLESDDLHYVRDNVAPAVIYRLQTDNIPGTKMQIKQQALAQNLQKKLVPIYVLTGQDNYLIEDCFNCIKTALKKSHDYDEKIISIQSPDDWTIITDEANSYSLFSEYTLINIIYDKKTFDATGKKILNEYLNSINNRCFIIIRAPNVPAKQLLWLSNHEQVVVVTVYPLSADAMKSWIVTQFKNNSLRIEAQIPELVYHYTQGNMLACAQVIEKIALTNGPNTLIGKEQALEHLSDQCEHSLFELVEVCLLGKGDKAIQILRQAANNKSESVLVLWILAQEIRLLIQLNFAMEQRKDFKTTCSQLKIWPQRTNLYHLAIKRFSTEHLRQLLHYCQLIDEQIKSSLNNQVWNSLESLALALCSGTMTGSLCAV